MSSSDVLCDAFCVPDAGQDDFVCRHRLRAGRSAEDLDMVADRLYVGSAEAGNDLNVLRQYGITHVVSILDPSPLRSFDGLHYMRLWLADEDDSDISRFFVRVFGFIRRALKRQNSRVLVHCLMGMSRSVTLACSYLMRARGLSADDALRLVRNSRFEANPNTGFRRQLQDFEWALHFEQTDNRRRHKNLHTAVLQCFREHDRQFMVPMVRIIVSFFAPLAVTSNT